MKNEQLVVLGGSFDPVHNGHILTCRTAIEKYGRVRVFPCGPREDKCTTDRINPVHRAAMLQLAFAGMEGVELDFSDLDRPVSTKTIELDARIRKEGFEPLHIIGSDLLYGKGGIRMWTEGQKAWETLHFLIFPREEYPIDPTDLPVHHQMLELVLKASSTQVRDLIYTAQDNLERVSTLNDLVPPPIVEYIETHQLYTGKMDRLVMPYSHPNPKIFGVYDPWRPESKDAVEQLQNVNDPAKADLILVGGGDGTYISAVQKYWAYRKPFFGVNFGTVGFLMNDVRDRITDPALFMNLELAQCPMLNVRATLPSGEIREALAFGDAWVEADRGDMAQFDVYVDGAKQVSYMGYVGLVATAAGSTAYHLNIRGEAFSIGTPNLGLAVGLGLPSHWKGTQLGENSVITFVNTNAGRRKMFGFADGKNAHDFGAVLSLEVRKSNSAGIRMLKIENDFVRKLNSRLFPSQ